MTDFSFSNISILDADLSSHRFLGYQFLKSINIKTIYVHLVSWIAPC